MGVAMSDVVGYTLFSIMALCCVAILVCWIGMLRAFLEMLRIEKRMRNEKERP